MFLPTLRWNVDQGFDDARIARVATTAIAALANSDGGAVILGVMADGRVLGLGPDCESLGVTPDHCADAVYRSLAMSIAQDLGVDAFGLIAPTIASSDGEEVCALRVAVGRKPLYLLDDGVPRLIAQRNGQIAELKGVEIVAYKAAHAAWGGQG